MAIEIGDFVFFPPRPLREFEPLGGGRLYALLARTNFGAWWTAYIGKSAELSDCGIGKSHHALQRWLSRGGLAEELFICESMQEFSDAELVRWEALLLARLDPELNDRPREVERFPGAWQMPRVAKGAR